MNATLILSVLLECKIVKYICTYVYITSIFLTAFLRTSQENTMVKRLLIYVYNMVFCIYNYIYSYIQETNSPKKIPVPIRINNVLYIYIL